MIELLEQILDYDEHRAGKKGSISATALIGNVYQTKLALIGDRTNMFKDRTKSIGAWLGSGMHLTMEKALSLNMDVHTEVYAEKYHIHTETTITGTADILYFKNNIWHLGDLKTTMYGKFDENQIEKARLQMSIYRYLLSEKYYISDEASILVVGRGKNIYSEIQVKLMTADEAYVYITNRIGKAKNIEEPDCFGGKFSMCDYCDLVCEFRK